MLPPSSLLWCVVVGNVGNVGKVGNVGNVGVIGDVGDSECMRMDCASSFKSDKL